MNKRGRPVKMTRVVIEKLEEAFSYGCSDREACLLANIGEQTLYDYQRKNPDFKSRKDLLKSNPILKARVSVVNNLEDDPNLALKYLERRCREEFDPKYQRPLFTPNRESDNGLTEEECQSFEELIDNLIPEQ